MSSSEEEGEVAAKAGPSKAEPAERDLGPWRVTREPRPREQVRVGGIPLGGPGFVVMAGPCAVEGEEQTDLAASAVRSAGAHLLRGGAFKPRTSPYAFQGLGEPGIQLLPRRGGGTGCR